MLSNFGSSWKNDVLIWHQLPAVILVGGEIGISSEKKHTPRSCCKRIPSDNCGTSSDEIPKPRRSSRQVTLCMPLSYHWVLLNSASQWKIMKVNISLINTDRVCFIENEQIIYSLTVTGFGQPSFIVYHTLAWNTSLELELELHSAGVCFFCDLKSSSQDICHNNQPQYQSTSKPVHQPKPIANRKATKTHKPDLPWSFFWSLVSRTL